MEKSSVKKSVDYVPKEEQKRVERIKKIMELEEYDYHGGRNDFAECIGMKPQNFSRCMNSGRVSEYTCKKIIKAFPSYTLDWLLGYSDSMTRAEEILNVISNADREAQLLHSGFSAFAQLSGFKVEVSPISGSVEDIVESIKAYCTISRADKSVTLSIDELNDFENELCDYVELRLSHMMR